MLSKTDFTKYASHKINLPISIEEKNLLAKFLIDDIFEWIKESNDFKNLDAYILRLNNHEPLQYITNKAYFLDFIFYVNESVLIPRPETEEVALKAIEVIKLFSCKNVLDVGTGSGCIPIAIKKALPNVNVSSVDVDPNALTVAKLNADKYDVDISLMCLDFLEESNWPILGGYDMIVSNPPYISVNEKMDMMSNVLDYEPHLALFSGSDTFIFYNKIAKFAAQHNSVVCCEINEHFPKETAAIFMDYGFLNVDILKDLQGKNRILVAK